MNSKRNVYQTMYLLNTVCKLKSAKYPNAVRIQYSMSHDTCIGYVQDA